MTKNWQREADLVNRSLHSAAEAATTLHRKSAVSRQSKRPGEWKERPGERKGLSVHAAHQEAVHAPLLVAQRLVKDVLVHAPGHGRPVVCIEAIGRLGNCLSQYAFVMSIAADYGIQGRLAGGECDALLRHGQRTLSYKTTHKHQSKVAANDHRNCSRDAVSCIEQMKEIFAGPIIEGPAPHTGTCQGATVPSKAFPHTHKAPRKLPALPRNYTGPANHFHIHGAWFTPPSRAYTVDLRQKLTFKPALAAFAAAAWSSISHRTTSGGSRSPTRVSVHVRRSDRVGHYHGKMDGTTGTYQEWVAGALRFFRLKYGNSTVFMVVSDDPKWCMSQDVFQAPDVHIHAQPGENAPTEGLDIYKIPKVVKDATGQDLAVLAHADHAILSAGTFGYWGAWLGPDSRHGTVLYHMPLLVANEEQRVMLKGTGWTGATSAWLGQVADKLERRRKGDLEDEARPGKVL
jgi:hypothetical protein